MPFTANATDVLRDLLILGQFALDTSLSPLSLPFAAQSRCMFASYRLLSGLSSLGFTPSCAKMKEQLTCELITCELMVCFVGRRHATDEASTLTPLMFQILVALSQGDRHGYAIM